VDQLIPYRRYPSQFPLQLRQEEKVKERSKRGSVARCMYSLDIVL
jgi:hypothetical protein